MIQVWIGQSSNFDVYLEKILKNSGFFLKYLEMNASRVSRPFKDPVDIAWNIGL